jgi:hypothetical protein
MKVLPDRFTYAKSARKAVTTIEIYGIESNPKSVENVWAEHRAPEQGSVIAKWKFNAATKSVLITDVVFPVDQGLAY